MNDSTKKYLNLVDHIDEYISNINIPPEQLRQFQVTVKSARQIVVTGTGTSLPTAQYLAAQLQDMHPSQSVRFLPTAKAIRAADRADKKDVFIVISYGLNRADSLIILEKAGSVCKTISISGNASVALVNNLNIVIPPKDEKIFCRPVSPLTTLIAINLLCGSHSVSTPMALDVKSLSDWIDPTKQTIILYAADVSYSAELWGIVLREGTGMNVSIKDMENYSHGYYGPDTAHLNDRQYIIMKSDSDEDNRDYERAKGLYEIHAFNKFIVEMKGDVVTANQTLFRTAPNLIANLLIRTGYDMYGPNGMEENRRYHEYEHYTDY